MDSMENRAYLITGGAGFIGSNFVLNWLEKKLEGSLIVLDKLTYAGHRSNLKKIEGNLQYHFFQGDILNDGLVKEILETYNPVGVIHFAAETHVDRSVKTALPFAETNVLGTCALLETVKNYWSSLNLQSKEGFRFIHISTDEVYGSLEASDPPIVEGSIYRPNSPYAASKAAADHFVRAFYKTYGFPIIITHSTNNFGPRQFPEKLLPFMISQALQGNPLPLYGDGKQKRSWLYVKDHCNALQVILEKGKIGESYHIGNEMEITNLELIEILCNNLDNLAPKKYPHSQLITFVQDRPGHDRRYALDCKKIQTELGWRAKNNFQEKIRETIVWYLENDDWLKQIETLPYKEWIRGQYRGLA